MNRIHGLLLVTMMQSMACGPSDTPEQGCEFSFLAGDLVISEVFANPTGQDQGREWFEVFNASSAMVSLDGLVLGAARPDGADERTHVVAMPVFVAPGEYVVLGDVASEFRPTYVDYGYGSELGGLRNSGGRISLSCGATVIDFAVYGDAPEDKSLNITGPTPPDATTNNEADVWCEATSEFDAGALGTPGQSNDVCGAVSTGTCIDGTGASRGVVEPVVGDILFTEVMPDPSQAGDSAGEWIELLVTADVDLNGVTIGKDTGTPIRLDSTDCISASAGTYILLARNDDPTMNGGLPTVDYTFSYNLSNAAGKLIVSIGDSELDAMTWTGSSPGRSISLDPGNFSPSANDDEALWCRGKTAFGDGDMGTPAAQNTGCIFDGMCLDGVTVRAIVPPVAGDIIFTEFMANPIIVSDSVGEWFEVLALRDFDLVGLEIGKAITDIKLTIQGDECQPVSAGTSLLFARSNSGNGPLPTPDFNFSFGLTNGGDSLFVGYAGTELDTITWTSSIAGQSTALDPALTAPADNDLETNWCPGTTPYGDADPNNGDQNMGTPQMANPSCP